MMSRRDTGSTRNPHGLRNPGLDPVLWNLVRVYSQRLNLDPYAVAAVSKVEGGGRFGEVGDNGSSFGPFQLHVGGALPAGRDAAWANSPAGVLYAMQHMAASGASGLRGLQAVNAIVRRFERPANPGAEVTSAFAGYKAYGPYTGGQSGVQTLPYNPQSGGLNAQTLPYNPNQFGKQWIQELKVQAAQFAKSQAAMLQQFKTEAAQTRQQNLAQSVAAQAQARVASAQAAQQMVSAAGSPSVSAATPAQALFDQRKQALGDVRLAALRRAGIG